MRIWRLSAIALIATTASASNASETRDLGAHVHGSGNLNIAIEGNVVAMELEAPGADIVGFEHEATTDEHRAAIATAISDLAQPLNLFVLPAGAGCTVTTANVALIGEDEDHGEGHHGDAHSGGEHAHQEKDADHAEHADHDKDADHAEHADHEKDADHAEHADHKHDADHAEHADHDQDVGHSEHADHEKDADHAEHAEHEGDETHTEFHATYTLECVDPSALDRIELAYFKRFPAAEELDVQMISAKGAQAFEVKRDSPVLDLRGML